MKQKRKKERKKATGLQTLKRTKHKDYNDNKQENSHHFKKFKLCGAIAVSFFSYANTLFRMLRI